MDADDTLAHVQRGLGHSFVDVELLRDALTHSSFANEKPDRSRGDNERLEFLGDAVLQWAVSALLFERFPDASAGELTRRRADLVCEEGLASLATAVDLGPALRLGRGEELTGGREKPRLLASAFEACIAAVYLDAGAARAMSVCRALFEDRVHDLDPGARDFKTRVQEWLQRSGRKPPRYQVLAATGPEHERRFEVAIMVDEQPLARGEGRTKLEAEQSAAEHALTLLEQGGDPA